MHLNYGWLSYYILVNEDDYSSLIIDSVYLGLFTIVIAKKNKNKK